MPVFERQSEIPCSAAVLFRWHAAPLAFERLAPPWERITVRAPLASLADGNRTTLQMGIGPVNVAWTARIENVRTGQDGGEAGFVDVQESGPFGAWRHEHRFLPLDAHRCMLHDRITFEMPGVPFSGLAQGSIEARLARTFRFRHDTTRLDVQLANELPPSKPLTVVVTGASGLIGTELVTLLSVLGHRPLRAVRRAAQDPDEILWDVASGRLDVREPIDAVVHLAGESIADGRLSADHLARITDSRVGATERLVASLATLTPRPRVFVSASAIGFYGARGDTALDEDSAQGTGALPDLCAAWERAAAGAAALGIRRVSARIGIVLSPAGGALKKQLPIFLAGAGGRIGDGRFHQPYVAVDDVAALLVRAVVDDRLSGPVNAVAPEPVTNQAFTETFARVLGRPAVVPVPAFALRIAFGRLADEALLASCRVTPKRISATGHTFRHPSLEAALRHVLGRVDA